MARARTGWLPFWRTYGRPDIDRPSEPRDPAKEAAATRAILAEAGMDQAQIDAVLADLARLLAG